MSDSHNHSCYPKSTKVEQVYQDFGAGGLNQLLSEVWGCAVTTQRFGNFDEFSPLRIPSTLFSVRFFSMHSSLWHGSERCNIVWLLIGTWQVSGVG